MNDYGFDYLNYITNVPGNTNQFNMEFSNNYMKDSMPKMNIMNAGLQKQVELTNPTEGLERGNLFANLYDPYKNYKAEKIKPKNEKEALMGQIMQYKFALTDLNLYLDTHPNDKNILNLYRKYLEIEKQICNQYESMYGPLMVNSITVTNGSWNWNNSPWPWEVK